MGVCCVGACGEDRVEGRDFGVDVGYVVEEGAVRVLVYPSSSNPHGYYLLVGSIAKVVHLQVELNRLSNILIQLLFIHRNKCEVVKRLETLDLFGGRLLLRIIIHQPPRHIRIEPIRHNIKQVLQPKIVSPKRELKAT